MPLANLHPNAKTAHIAAECADEQGKFWEYHDVLFEKQNQWNRISLDAASENFKGYAAELGLNSASFDTCLSSKSIADEVNADLVEAGQYGATGTPTFFIGNEKDGFIKLVGAQPFSAFQVIIDKQLG
jgi:protein-disulfide isomerase